RARNRIPETGNRPMTTQRQIEANQRNSSRSTGPKTDQDRLISRRNALRHGLAPTLVLPDEAAEAVRQRAAELQQAFKPGDGWESWVLAEVVAVAAVQVERGNRRVHQLEGQAAERALRCWDVDCRVDVEEVAARLARDPSRTVARLRKSLHGAGWLRLRW